MLLSFFAEGVEAVDAEEHAEADHRGDDAEHLGGGVEGVAHVDGDERGEAADDEHTGGHGEITKSRAAWWRMKLMPCFMSSKILPRVELFSDA